jgi:1-deoxy-D-xylulose-5-phosphate synthase
VTAELASTDLGALSELDRRGLQVLVERIRAFLVEKVCATGGHLGSNLGVVELTVALHRVFDSPRDAIVFDTGHQTYVHKILTGRAGGFDGLRQDGGLSGYASREESEHDWVENSHASTALSYADGLAKASESGSRHVVAVIGDGALTGGLAWEGLNNLAARPDRPVVVVLNDNGRSYDPTVGGIAHHLAALRAQQWPVTTGTVFEHLGLAYLGPVDGHDVAKLEEVLRSARALGRSVVVHVVSRKGSGYRPAEADEVDHMHGIGVLDPATGRPPTAGGSGPSWTNEFGRELVAVGERRPDVVAVTAAMLRPVGLAAFASRFPDRVVDVGIAEQHAVCSAAGMAMGGLHPVVCLYATFLNRAVDQALMDVALHRLGVTFVLDRAGITGPDGASHHGMWDIALLAAVPGLRLAAPRDVTRLRELLDEAVEHDDGPTAIRFPKDTAGTEVQALARMDGIDILHRGHRLPLDVLIVAAGPMAVPALATARVLNAEGVGVTVIDPRWILPVHPTVAHFAARHRLVVTVEDGLRHGGMGSAITQTCADQGVTTLVRTVGLPSAFVPHGNRAGLLSRYGLSTDGIVNVVRNALGLR